MKKNKKLIKNGVQFLLEIIGIFILIQIISYVIGNWSAISIAVFLLSITLTLFVAAFLSARKKDKRKINKPSSGLISGV